MSYRKGELNAAAIDRNWPHQVALKSSTVQAQYFAIEKMKSDFEGSPRGHAVYHGNEWYSVYCFADAERAELFRQRFDGEPFNPEDRGRGSNWANWNKPQRTPM